MRQLWVTGIHRGWRVGCELDKSLKTQRVSEKFEVGSIADGNTVLVSLPFGECVCEPARFEGWFHSSLGFSLTQHLLV